MKYNHFWICRVVVRKSSISGGLGWFGGEWRIPGKTFVVGWWVFCLVVCCSWGGVLVGFFSVVVGISGFMGGPNKSGVWWHFAVDKGACLAGWVRDYLKDLPGPMVPT